MPRERTRCKPTGAEHERLRYGLVEWTPEDKPVTRARNVPVDDPWYEKATAGTPEPLDAAGQTGQDTGYLVAERGYRRCLTLIHSMWMDLRVPLEGAPLPRCDLRLSLLLGRDRVGLVGARCALLRYLGLAIPRRAHAEEKGSPAPLDRGSLPIQGREITILGRAPTQRRRGERQVCVEA